MIQKVLKEGNRILVMIQILIAVNKIVQEKWTLKFNKNKNQQALYYLTLIRKVKIPLKVHSIL